MSERLDPSKSREETLFQASLLASGGLGQSGVLWLVDTSLRCLSSSLHGLLPVCLQISLSYADTNHNGLELTLLSF